ncbi:MAG: class I SAM-dependent methyltransferase [Archaeoglobaceae archaeon]
MGSMDGVHVFNEFAGEYDQWFDRNKLVFESEVQAIKRFLPEGECRGLEVGTGSGRFASAFGLTGIDPAKSMVKIARDRGVDVLVATAERIPFKDGSFDVVLMVTTLCFLQEPLQALKEVERVLKSGGSIIIGMVPEDSFLGKKYSMSDSKFYRHASFYTVDQVLTLFRELGFNNLKTCQTLFNDPKELKNVEPVREGHGEGGFVVIYGQKR